MTAAGSRGLARVVVVGPTGAGKSVLAQRLAARLGAPYIELDELFWDAGWTQAAPDVFRTRVGRATDRPRWVVAGNYGRVRDLLWPRADTIVWLDYAFPLVLPPPDRPDCPPGRHRRGPWNGNASTSGSTAVWSEKSLFHWLVKTYWAYRRELRPSSSPSPSTAHLRMRLPAP